MKQEPDEPAPADRLTIAQALREMAELLAVSGQEPFKARAYLRGAEVLERLEADLADLVRTRRLTTLPGIGVALAAMITDLFESGHSPTLDEQRQRVPAFVRELSRIPRLGADKIVKLHEALGVETLEDLETACVAGRVRTLKGMGEKTERRILDDIRRLRQPEAQRLPLPQPPADPHPSPAFSAPPPGDDR